MEYENHYAKDQGARALGVVGTTAGGISLLSALSNGGLNLLGGGRGGGGCGEDHYVNRYEAQQQNELTAKDMEIAYLRSRDAAKDDDLKLYQSVDARLRAMEAQNAQQGVINAQVSANISCMQNQMQVYSALFKTVIPIDNVCPNPMPQYNSWTAPTASTTAG